jgi:hypothetical protein
VSTAKIGADADAVVDSKLRVHRLRGLAWPSYMIGGPAAELNKADG